MPFKTCTASDLASITSHIHSWVFFLLWLHPFILSGVISPRRSSSILGTYWPGEFLFQYPIILPFHTVHGVLKARILKWFAIPFSSGPREAPVSSETFTACSSWGFSCWKESMAFHALCSLSCILASYPCSSDRQGNPLMPRALEGTIQVRQWRCRLKPQGGTGLFSLLIFSH